MYSGGVVSSSPPPGFVRLVGHRVRWRLLGELARSDRRVGELAGLVGEPQNLVSYHLGQLRAGGLVIARRSAADGRDSYYRLELFRCEQGLAAAGAALHPGLRLAPPSRPPAAAGGYPVGCRVLFLCTGNSARSQMAEAFLHAMTAGQVQAVSAGSRPKPLHPNAVTVMRDYGIDLTGRRSKHLDVFAGEHFDYVISLCDRVREVCPEFPGPPELVHWSMPDPAAEAATAAASYPAFQRTAAELETRIQFLLCVLEDPQPEEVP